MIVIPSSGPESWRALLADPEKHWRKGYSARTLAHCWEAARGLPPEIAALFGADAALLLALPEHRVELPGKGRPSQTDLFAFVRCAGKTIACALEGKVTEPFGPTLAEWSADMTSAKAERLAAILAMLGISSPTENLRYQLLHRTASAIIEARRFKTDAAAMIVHSFSTEDFGFADCTAFLACFGLRAEIGRLHRLSLPDGLPLLIGWARGDLRFLAS